MKSQLGFPFRIGPARVPVALSPSVAVREQLEQLLFTLPGERVNRPDFGCGVQRLVFSGATAETAAAAEYTIAVAVRRFLAEQVQFEAVRVTVDSVTLTIDLLYTVRATGEERAESFARVLEGP
ncbi:MAG: GPW/gp25 family protein [Myxococcota bacterium]